MLSDTYCEILGSDPDMLCNSTRIAMIALENMALSTNNIDLYFEAVSLCDALLNDTSEKMISPSEYVQLKLEKSYAIIEVIETLESDDNVSEETWLQVFSLIDALYNDSMTLIHGRSTYGVDIRQLVTAGSDAIFSQKVTEDDLIAIFDIEPNHAPCA